MKSRRELLVAWIKTLAVFVVIGPLVGYIVVAAIVSLWGWMLGPKDAAWLGPFVMIYGWPFAHFVGAPSALVAGVTAALLLHSARIAAWWAGLVSGGMAALFDWSRGGLLAAHDGFNGLEIIVVVTHLVAAQVCWVIVRRWRAPVSDPDQPTSM